jgi:D-alanyl-lipoteichoic acid acyltransferase DltB (MBOAT superfamily)
LVANYFFYSWWDWRFLSLIIFISAVNYFCSIQIGKIDPDSPGIRRKLFLAISILINIGLLGIFKYFNFFAESASLLLNTIGFKADAITLNIILPIGISFYTFQTMSYTLDVYNTKIEPTKNIIAFFAYISFFPLVLAGPIERAGNLLTQFLKKREFNYDEATDGLRQILWGLFKKVVIADRLAILVNQVYNNAGNYEGVPLLLATYFFAFQIYCDFSGYSDIAIGSAKLLGFRLMTNFRTPYFSKDITEFWRRWHISLSTWLRDYLFIPLNLQLRYLRNFGALLAVMITFLICGLWHGANWTYIIWGAIHAFYLVFAVITLNIANKVYNFLRLKKGTTIRKFVDVFLTFHLVLFAWIFFRANSLNDAVYIITHIFPLNLSEFISMLSSTGATQTALGLTKRGITLALISIGIMEFVHLMGRNKKNSTFLKNKPIVIRWAIYYALIIAIISFGEFNMKEFIYFQF